MPPSNRLLKIALPIIVLVFGLPPAVAQWVTPPQALQRNMMLSTEKNLREHLKDYQKEGEEPGAGQQTWRIRKGKDFARLPPEFQWDEAPTAIDTPLPVYPFEKLRSGEAGRVLVYFAIGPDGRTYGARLEEVSAPEFGQAVLAMLDVCRFNPPVKNGKPGYAYLGREYAFRSAGRSDGPVSPEARKILRQLKNQPESIATLGQLDHPLKPVARPGPVYPSALKQEHPAGTAEVEFYVDEDGQVQLPSILNSTAPEFGYAVVQAVAGWRFEPPRNGGKAVVARAVVPIDFAGRSAAGAQK